MSERKWTLIFEGWKNREETIRLLCAFFISSTIITTFLTILGFILKSTDFQWVCLGYSIFFLIHTIIFYITKKQYAIFAFVLSIVMGFPLWAYLIQDVKVISYISLILIVTAVIFTNFRLTSAIYAFTLLNLIAIALLDVFGILSNPNLGYPLSILALLQIPLLSVGYIVAFYVNKILLKSLKAQNTQFQLLKDTQTQLINQEKFKSIKLLAGGIAHDFNNLLTVILGNINLLRLDLVNHSESLELIEEVEAASAQARDLTKELLTFSKETVHLTELVNLSTLLRKSVKFASSGSKTKTITDISTNLWKVQGNPTQLAQVFQNLILNARQAMQANPLGGIIQIIAKNIQLKKENRFNLESGSYISIKVIDSGKGISEEDLPNLFNPYFTTKIGGNGLGLAISHTIVENHGGAITVESTPHKETVFEILIPAYTETKVNGGYEKNGDVLILEEDENLIRILKKDLSKLGHTLDVASTCEEVKSLLEDSVKNKAPYKVIILDTLMPIDSHLCESTFILKKIYNDVKIILSSDFAIHPVIKNYRQHGFDAYLPKPFQIRDIRNLIQSLTLHQTAVI
jgi:signal transduction histidine kinase/CheY-like chemotaxis protein